MPCTNPYSPNTFTGDDSTDTYQFTFALPGTFSSVLVYQKDTGETAFTELTENVDFTVNRSALTITLTAGNLPTGSVLSVKRCTTRTRQVDYISGSVNKSQTMDNDSNRATAVMQEVEADGLDALIKNATGDAWEGEGLPSENCAPATDANGWVTLGQARALIAGAEIYEIDNATYFSWTGDGTETEYELENFKQLTAENVQVYVGGARQDPAVAYTIVSSDDSGYPSSGGQWDYLVMDTAVPNGVKLWALVITGTFMGTIADNQLSGDELDDDSITTRHVYVPAGTAGRVWVFDANGDPSAAQLAHTDLSDFDTGVRQNRLDQMAAPAASVSFANQLLTNLQTPVSNNDAATKAYADGVANSVIAYRTDTFNMPDGLGNSRTFNTPIQPQLAVITGVWYKSGAAHWVSYFASMVSGRSTVLVNGSRDETGQIPMELRFEWLSNGKFRVTVERLNDHGAWDGNENIVLVKLL